MTNKNDCDPPIHCDPAGGWLCDQWKPDMVGEYTDGELAALLNKHKIMPPKEYNGTSTLPSSPNRSGSQPGGDKNALLEDMQYYEAQEFLLDVIQRLGAPVVFPNHYVKAMIEYANRKPQPSRAVQELFEEKKQKTWDRILNSNYESQPSQLGEGKGWPTKSEILDEAKKQESDFVRGDHRTTIEEAFLRAYVYLNQFKPPLPEQEQEDINEAIKLVEFWFDKISKVPSWITIKSALKSKPTDGWSDGDMEKAFKSGEALGEESASRGWFDKLNNPDFPQWLSSFKLKQTKP